MKTQQSFTRVVAFLLLGLVVGAVAACGDGGGDAADAARDASAADAMITADAAVVTMPALHPVLQDRMGRPAVNTALNAPFESDTAIKDAAKGAYNRAVGAAMWQAFVPEIASNLAIIDALDTHLADGGCDTQPLYNATPDTATSGYVQLAGALADDRLYVDTTQSVCVIFLGVEAFALDLTETRTCGGRVPQVLARTQDPIDMAYGVLAGGLPRVGVITDGIDTDDQQALVSNDVFPFLAPPSAPL